MRYVRLKIHWWLLILGISLGVLTGGWPCWTNPVWSFYVKCHYFRLATAMLAHQVDQHVLIYLGIIAVTLISVYAGRRLKGPFRIVFPILFPLGVLGVAAKLYAPVVLSSPIGQWLKNLPWSLIVIISCSLFIVLLLSYHFLQRRYPRTTTIIVQKTYRWLKVVRTCGIGIALLLLLCFLVINSAALICGTTSSVAMTQRPNVILIMVCSLRADHLGCYGYDLNTTPNIDRFARESTRFTEALSPSSWTLWSTASILTSRYPQRIFDKSETLAQYALYPGIPATFSNLGYVTNAVTGHPFFSKEHEWSYVIRQGFDDIGLTADQGFDAATSPAITDMALQRLTQMQARKFLQVVMYVDPHSPYQQHPGMVFGPSRKDVLGKRWASSLARSVPKEKLVERQAELVRYDSEVAFTDQAIGDYLAGLKTLGVYDDAMIIICGDHGEEFMEHGGYGHSYTLYREVMNVPLLIKFPRQTRGKVIGGSFPLIDLFPSLLSVLHVNASSLGLQGEGVDLTTLLRCTDKPIYGATIDKARSVIDDQYKYFYRGTQPDFRQECLGQCVPQASGGKEQLFNLRNDRKEYRNLLPQKAGVAVSLKDLMRRHDLRLNQMETIVGPASSITNVDDVKALQQMRSLGYLQ